MAVLVYLSWATYPPSLAVTQVRIGQDTFNANGCRYRWVCTIMCSRTALWSNYVLLEPVPHLLNCCLPIPLFVQGITIQHVWYYGWITALSTGLGTLPFLIVSEMNQWWLGVSNGTSSCMSWPHCLLAPGHYSLMKGTGWGP